MYQYNDNDQTLINERVTQFRDQTQRYLNGDMGEDEFRTLRLMNGVYIQIHAPMMRIAIPYGLLSAAQLRTLASISRKYDKGYAHFTTRQNLQLNWPTIESIPDILADLAKVQMHAIQTSGNCIRNTTSDHFAGVTPDEITDPRPYCEIIRQWTTFHPEFSYLPRKFKIAVSSSAQDRAATQLHDIGVHVIKNSSGDCGFRILVGGGLGRTPIIGTEIRPFLAQKDLLSYLEAIVRIYNLNGRRDNKYKARIKILVREEGIDKIRAQVEAEWLRIKDGMEIPAQTFIDMQAQFLPPAYDTNAQENASLIQAENNPEFATWLQHNTATHKVTGYRIVFLSLKAPDSPPGDILAGQLDAVADLADAYSFGEIRSTHRQNLVLADVNQADLYSLWQKLSALKLATPNIGTATDIICCPGLDFCNLANATSIDITHEINQALDNLDYLHDLGELNINISGCMNGCAHQSVGHIGILGVDKKGAEWYQITLGGSSANTAAIGQKLGASISKANIIAAIKAILATYIEQREGSEENFLDTFNRVGITPFKEKVYANH